MKSSDGAWIGGVFVGTRILPGVFAEEVANRRYLIRKVDTPDFAKRLGEVMGGNLHYQACRMNGEHVGISRSLSGAAKLLV